MKMTKWILENPKKIIKIIFYDFQNEIKSRFYELKSSFLKSKFKSKTHPVKLKTGEDYKEESVMAFDLDDNELRATREMFGLEKSNDTKDKIIDKMAEFINEQDIDEDICKNENGELCNDEGSNCIECIKEHFKKEEEE